MKNNNSHLPFPVAFRKDINGLRAWAVVTECIHIERPCYSHKASPKI